MAISPLTALYPTTSEDATSANSKVLTLVSGAAVGDLVAVFYAGAGGASASTFTVADSKGNTWTVHPSGWTLNNNEAMIATSKLTTALVAGDTITVGTNIARTKRIYKVKGWTGVNALDGAVQVTTGSSTTPQTTHPATSGAGDLIIPLVAFNGPTPSTVTWDAAYTGSDTLSTAIGTADKVFSTAYRVGGAAGETPAPTLTLAASRSWAMVSVMFTASTTTTQVARPVSDITTTGWATVPSGTTPFAAVVGETSPDDSTYFVSPDAPSGAVIEVKLSALSPPTDKTNHTFRVRMRQINASSNSNTVVLVQGTTVIATFNQAVTGSFVTYSFTLTTTQANTITDYSDLRIRISATATP